ncbi:LytTR family DNA-binding domain-containing protein [Flammeovirga yaeyamensis]|uniref:LytTR family DNA-binding domain-containing protein n=1 Tax=Flammeovirga yaeyamensis TaxID=367791 RepID=A0AAX1MYL5_9BACT|nr:MULTISPECIES: LytTR family DNA-binding domain-containing protein [Flammeovirga]ANQ48165.1 response regulator transcription factor [Flammeovirga sp. MY04]MBB3696084.1 DNA-binding LytR/AlgR family response regulator [Flammeovirga yaeyamensis]NMF34769.1 response regulator transcription factor [Flammeovirga yaeyamensis]QWG00403.1 LytTR family DNA-binding domain-containing protein [Flammeovirga yaeyamensis]
MPTSNSKLKCIVIDDEELAREGLASYVEQVPFLELISTAKSAMEAQEIIDDQTVDLCFCDINMPYLSGIDWLKTLSNPPIMILTTAYSEYALEGYEINVLDYLLKPISFDRFYKSCLKAKDAHQKIATEPLEFIYIKVDQQIKKIWCDDIQYIEAQNNYIKIKTAESECITYLTLKEIQEKLSDDFIKVQKSFIVNKKAVDAIEGNCVIVGDQMITLSRNNKQEIINSLTQGNLIIKGLKL